MEIVDITIADDHLLRLKEIASDFNITIEELIRLSIERLLLQPEAALKQAIDYLLDKNRELYQRLA